MAEASISISQDYFGCSICLQVLKEPVTTPCGHSFCKVCINGFWDSEVPKKIYSCPHCRETFTPRPDLRKSNVLTEIIELVEKSEQQTSFAQALDSFDTQDAECDCCIGEKNKAVKSCLTCMASYCHIHVQAHHESPAFKKHTLIKAMSNLPEKTCAQHNKLLDVFCRKDQRVICHQCSTDKHSDHETVPVEKEWIEKKKYFEELQQKYHNRLENKEKTLLELKDVIAAYKISTQELVKESDGIFSELIASIEKRRFEVTKIIRAQEKAELDQTAEVLQQLEAEIADIKKRQADLEKLSQTTGYVHFLQRFQFLSPKLETTADTFSVTFNSQWSFESLKKTLIQLKEEMDDFCKEKMEKLSEIAVTFDPILIMPEPQTREEFLKYSCQLSFDPNTANCYLGLSSESTDVTCANKQHVYPDHPERFSNWTQVLCKQTLPLRSYWEVEVDGANGVSIAVSYKSISRKGSEFGSRFGHNAQSWRLVRYPSKYSFWQNNTRSDVSRPGSRRIGVYLDQKAGTLSFYSVSNQMSLIYKLTTVFTQPLYAGFGLGTGSSAKICLQVSAAMTAVDGAESLKKK